MHCNAGANNVEITDREGFAWKAKMLFYIKIKFWLNGKEDYICFYI